MARSLQQTPSARAFHDSVVLKDTIFLWGGHSGNCDEYHSSLDMFSVNMLTGEWHQHAVTPPDEVPPRQHACSATIGNTIYSYGGLISYRPFRTCEELYKLTLEKMRWRRLETKGVKPEGRHRAGMCSVNGKLLLMGGYGPLPSQMKHPQAQYKNDRYNEDRAFNNELFEFDPQTGCWSPVCVTGSKPSPRTGHTLTAVDKTKAILFGGNDGRKNLNDVWLFDDEGKAWSYITPSSPMWPQPREDHTLCTVVSDNHEIKVLLMGGCSDMYVLSDCWLLDVIRGIGEKVMVDGETLSRQGHSADCVTLLDGTVVVSVFGGFKTTSVYSVVSNPCFYQWDPRRRSVLRSGLAPAGAVLRQTEHIDPRLPSMLPPGLTPARDVRHADPRVSAASLSPAGGTNEEMGRLKEEVQQLTAIAEKQQGQIDQMNAQIIEERTRADYLEEMKRQADRARCMAEGEISRIREEYSAFLQQIEQSRKELSVQVQVNDEQKAHLKAKESQMRQLETQNTELTEHNKDMTKQVEEVQIRIMETENLIQQICRREAELQQENEEQATMILKEGNARLSQENEKMLTHIQSLEKQAAELHQTVAFQHAQLQKLRQQSDEQSTQIQSLEALTAKMDEHIQQVCTENAQLKAEQVPCISSDKGIGDQSREGGLLS